MPDLRGWVGVRFLAARYRTALASRMLVGTLGAERLGLIELRRAAIQRRRMVGQLTFAGRLGLPRPILRQMTSIELRLGKQADLVVGAGPWASSPLWTVK